MSPKYIAEFIGTFAVVFCGTGAIVIDQESGGAIGHPGIAATFGLVVMCMIYALGPISGAQFNPAVTIGFALSGRFNIKDTAPYIASQLAGALFGTVLLKFLFPTNAGLGATLPTGSQAQSFVLEAVLTFLLMLVILRVSQGPKETAIFAGLAIGGTVLLEALFAGPICGASMNPARSFSPAVVSGNVSALWVYLLAPITGSVTATLAWRFLDREGT